MFDDTAYLVPATLCSCLDRDGKPWLRIESPAVRCLDATIEDGKLVADFDDETYDDDDANTERLICVICGQAWELEPEHVCDDECRSNGCTDRFST